MDWGPDSSVYRLSRCVWNVGGLAGQTDHTPHLKRSMPKPCRKP